MSKTQISPAQEREAGRLLESVSRSDYGYSNAVRMTRHNTCVSHDLEYKGYRKGNHWFSYDGEYAKGIIAIENVEYGTNSGGSEVLQFYTISVEINGVTYDRRLREVKTY